MATHYRKTMLAYRKRKQTKGCPFCAPETLGKAVFENSSVFIVPNLTKYDLWELHDVEDHLLIVPKRHVKSLADLSSREQSAVMNIYVDYESKGYSVYARGVGFARRSIEHQHSHLIKANNKQPRFAIFSRRPYYLIKF